MVVLLLCLFGMLVPCVFAEPLHARVLAERQIEIIPEVISDIVSDIFTSTSFSEYVSKLFQQVAQTLCEGTVTSLLQSLSGPATEEFIQTTTASLLDGCIVGLAVILAVDPPTELLDVFAGKVMCATLVNAIIDLLFNQVTSVACEAVGNISSSPTPSPPPSNPNPTSPLPSACNCLAPTCVCPWDNGLPPHCGSERGEPSCGICAC
jgi:hypothetical protein